MTNRILGQHQAAVGLAMAAGLAYGVGVLADPNTHLWAFLAMFLLAVGLSVASVRLAHLGLRRSREASNRSGPAILVLVFCYLVLLPLALLLGIYVAAGLGSF